MLMSLSLAGGFTRFADADRIVIVRRDARGERRIPFDYSAVVSHGRPPGEHRAGARRHRHRSLKAASHGRAVSQSPEAAPLLLRRDARRRHPPRRGVPAPRDARRAHDAARREESALLRARRAGGASTTRASTTSRRRATRASSTSEPSGAWRLARWSSCSSFYVVPPIEIGRGIFLVAVALSVVGRARVAHPLQRRDRGLGLPAAHAHRRQRRARARAGADGQRAARPGPRARGHAGARPRRRWIRRQAWSARTGISSTW